MIDFQLVALTGIILAPIRCNLIYLVCYCTNEQGPGIGHPQLTFRVSSSTAKNAQKLQYYIITGPKLGGGGVRGASVKSQSITFLKPSLIENSTKIVQRRVVLLK